MNFSCCARILLLITWSLTVKFSPQISCAWRFRLPSFDLIGHTHGVASCAWSIVLVSMPNNFRVGRWKSEVIYSSKQRLEPRHFSFWFWIKLGSFQAIINPNKLAMLLTSKKILCTTVGTIISRKERELPGYIVCVR